MGRHFSLLVLGVDRDKPGMFGIFQDAGLIATSCHSELQSAWNHIATMAPADLVIISLAAQGRQGCPIALTDVIEHLRTRWGGVTLLAVGNAARRMPQNSVLGVDEILTDIEDGSQLVSAVEKHLEQVLDLHIQALNVQHTDIARSFRQLQQNCSIEKQRSYSQQILRTLEAHFAFEEKFMAAHGYEHLQDHADGHARLLVKAKKAITSCRLGEVDAALRAWQDVRAEMDTHIRDDQTYLGFLEEMRQELSNQLHQLATVV